MSLMGGDMLIEVRFDSGAHEKLMASFARSSENSD